MKMAGVKKKNVRWWEEGLRWTYTGHSKINVTTQFYPRDVVTTAAGHIIVCDHTCPPCFI
jgi:hypothetical protein